MSVLTKDDFLARIRERIGEDDTDESISYMEDMSDTYEDLVGRVNTSQEDWKTKYENLDKDWRQKYKARFFSGTALEDAKEEQEEDIKEDSKPLTFGDLFKKREV